jgi:hypothetical protein
MPAADNDDYHEDNDISGPLRPGERVISHNLPREQRPGGIKSPEEENRLRCASQGSRRARPRPYSRCSDGSETVHTSKNRASHDQEALYATPAWPGQECAPERALAVPFLLLMNGRRNRLRK